MIARLMDTHRDARLDGPETRQAPDKLAAIRPMIGHPITWRDYTAFVVRGDNLVGNVMRARIFDYNFWLAKFGRDQRILVQVATKSCFLPGSCSSRSLTRGGRRRQIYGAFGTVIGHEISHAFDDQAAASMARVTCAPGGPRSPQRFDGKTRSLIAQYDAFRRLPGLQVNGTLTFGEGRRRQCGPCHRRAGLLAFARRGCAAPGLDGYTGAVSIHQLRANLAGQNARCGAHRAAQGGPAGGGPVPRQRSLPNQGSFDSAFDVKPGDAMYLPPEHRISLWQVGRQVMCKGKAR